jgi:FAD/FMN-containing dehydrogenase
MSIEISTLSGGTARLADEQVEELRMLFHGPLYAPGDPGYDEVRVVQNGMFDRRPGLIIQCSGSADVIDAVNLAREHGLLTAVRGGGHSIAGLCSCDGGLLIDLSEMRGVWVDSDARVVRVQGGATWGDVDRETQQVGLVVPGGVVSTTGVGGLTLGGGIGWVHRKYGLACDNLRAVELVTADGELTRASEAENADLFWGLRGGGGNFGVVTAFEFDAHPFGPIAMCAAPIYGVDNANDIMRLWRDWASTSPDEITTRAVFWSMPADPHLPEAVHDQQVLILGAVHTGSPEEGARALQPIREFGTPLADLSEQMPFRVFQAAFDPFFPRGQVSSYWKSSYMNELSDDAIDFIAKVATSRPSPLTLVHVPLLGGAMGRVAATDTAFGDRSAPYMLSVDGNWTEGDDDRNVAWVRDVMREAERFTTGGTYLNFDGHDEESGDLVEAAYGANFAKLRELKRKYDPNNLFRLNNNIPTS